MRRSKIFLLLEDDTIGSVTSNPLKSPSTYQGKKVIFAAPHLTDIDMLRMILRSTLVGQQFFDREREPLNPSF